MRGPFRHLFRLLLPVQPPSLSPHHLPVAPAANSVQLVAVTLVAAIFTTVLSALDHNLGPSRDKWVLAAMSTTQEQDPAHSNQNVVDGGEDRDPGLTGVPVIPLAEGSDGIAGTAAFLASQAVARALLEEGARQQATQPTIKENRDTPSAEQEEDPEEGEEEEEEEELDYDSMEKDEYKEKDHDDEVQEEGRESIVGAHELPMAGF